MPTPKDGTAGSAVAPAEAVAPEPADESDPSKVSEIKADQIQTQTGKYGTQKVTPYKPPTAEEQEAAATQQAQQEERQHQARQQADEEISEEAAEEEALAEQAAIAQEKAIQKKTDWIEIELVGMDDSPIAGMPYEIVLPDGKTVDKGTTDSKGKARLSGLAAGNCKITFPTLDQWAWEEVKPG
jgi:hypothetical protein